MIPDTASVETEGSTVYWTNEGFQVEVEEAEKIADEVRKAMKKPGVDGVVVDNREAEGTWPSEVDEVWDELMAEMYEEGISCATICASATNSLHINRLSRNNGTDDRIKAFDPDEAGEAEEFVN